MMLSTQLITAIKTSKLRQYQLAQLAGLHPSTLSKWVAGIEHPRDGDPRVVRIGALVNVPAPACFEPREDRVPA